jgi:hypothetical protein
VDFYFEKDTANGRSLFEGKIRGMRLEDSAPPKKGDVRWVKLENCAWAFKEEKVNQWLSLYGVMLSPLEEEEQKFDSDDTDDCEDPVGNGNLATRMKLEKKIPQFLPMLGRKIKVYYRGIEKLCINCYKPGHIKKDCKNQTVGWITYVENFMQENDFDNSLYGNWNRIVDNIKQKREMEEQKKKLVEEVKERATNPNTKIRSDAEEQRTDGSEGEREREGPKGPRRFLLSKERGGEGNKKSAQNRTGGVGETGGVRGETTIGGRQGQNLKEKAIAVKSRVDSQRKNSI